MASYRIRFEPDGREVVVEEGKTLLEAARAAGVYVGSVCGGEGVCGRCRVVIRRGEVQGESTAFLTREEIRQGYVLACQVVPKGDLLVEVPPESRLGGYKEIGKDGERFRDFTPRGAPAPASVRPLVEKFPIALPAPSLEDPTADQERLLSRVAKLRPGPLQMGLKIASELPRLLRRLDAKESTWKWEWDGRVTATVGMRGAVNEVLLVERGDTSERGLGLVLDIGTTTVVAHLVDLKTGATREAAALYNSQAGFGADVISRINYARRPGGAAELHRAVVHDVETLIEDLVQRSRIGRGDILAAIAAGNTVMLHFLLGLEADPIRISPFVPAAAAPPPVRAAEVGIRIHPRALLYVMPMVGSFVGGDITAGILASGIHRRDELALLIDIGTNGEVVLGNRDYLVACSASAGPAFEGGSVKCGMRATAGAIDTVRISAGIEASVTTIDDAPPAGLCGTGLVDALAEMFLAGLMDRAGRLNPGRAPGRFRASEEDGRPEFVLVPAGESRAARDITISQADIDNLIHTKASIYAAIDSMMRILNHRLDDVRALYIAGAFGNRLDVGRCVAIGLLPDIPLQRMKFIGNGSIAGAKMSLLDRRRFEEAMALRERITYQELMVDASYMEKFTAACFLPHTDLSRFPSVEARLAAAGRETGGGANP